MEVNTGDRGPIENLPMKSSSAPGDEGDLQEGVEVQGANTAECVGPTSLNLGNSMKFEGIPQRFSYNQLSVATGAFSKDSKLMQGGPYWIVYRGVLPSGNRVAVKRMNRSMHSQGTEKFEQEISILVQLGHRNLIELQGWCEDRARNEYMLVHELMLNGSLDEVLFNQAEGTTCLSWPQRFNILTGTAAALEYLHQGWKRQVLHREVKCCNIMLDNDWTAKLEGDFRIARLVDQEREATATNMAGNFGYIAPEVLSDLTFTDKADIYGFGVVLLEIACGRRVLPSNSNEQGLVSWVRVTYKNGDLLSMADKKLTDYDAHQLEIVLKVGLLCTHDNPTARPSMKRVLQMLERDVKISSILPIDSISRPDELRAGKTLHFEESLVSAAKEYTFVNQADGNLVTYKKHGVATWASGTYGRLSRGDLKLLMDGNLVLYDTEGNGQPVWASMSPGVSRAEGPYRLIMQDDGNLVIYGANEAAWASWGATGSGLYTSVAGRAEMPSEIKTWLGTFDALVSSNRLYKFVNQGDGNLCIHNQDGDVTWASDTCNKGPGNLYMQRDGNLVLKNTYGKEASPGAAIWLSGTYGRGTGPHRLIMQDDGNLVIYDANSTPTWASNKDVWSEIPSTDTLPSGRVLRTQETLISRNRMYTFINQGDGNLVIYNQVGRATWASGTYGQGVGNLHLQRDGNLVLYHTDGKAWTRTQTNPDAPIWSSGASKGAGTFKLIMQDDGNLVMYNQALDRVWSTNTN